MRNHPEHDEQCKVVAWAHMQEQVHPELKMLFAVPNSAKRNPRQGKWMKDEGMKAGVPDLFLMVPRGDFGALTIEMKSEHGKLSDEQKVWKDNLVKYGYCHFVCYSFEDAQQVILAYLANNIASENQLQPVIDTRDWIAG